MTKKKSNKKRITVKKTTTMGRKAAKKAASNMSKKRVPKKKISSKKRSAKTNATTKSSTRSSGRKQRTSENKSPEVGFEFRGPRPQRSSQSGDSQGLSRRQGADSESVEELIEEGNAFEADAVSGVEDAGEHEEEEVHTHEVPEDDVPGEYLNEE